MSRPVLAALLLLCLPSWSFAQQGEQPKAQVQDPEAAYQELARGLQKAIEEWRADAKKKAEQAQKSGAPMVAMSMRPPTAEFVAKAQQLAAQFAGQDAAIPFLTFVCKNATSERDAVKQALQTLTKDHSESPQIVAVLPFLEMAAVRFNAFADVRKLLDEVVVGTALVDVKAQALIARGTLRLMAAANDADRAAAKADLKAVAEITENADLLGEAAGVLFELENLQVGCKAPDIVAKDTEGVEFKLSDYRGKVILLDFWGFW